MTENKEHFRQFFFQVLVEIPSVKQYQNFTHVK